MKNIILSFFFLIVLSPLFAQIDSIRITPTGATVVQFKVNALSSLTYQRSVSWVNETYKNPHEVITGQIDSKSLNVSGFASHAFYYTSMGIRSNFDMKYMLYITINDSIVNFKIQPETFYLDGGKCFWLCEAFFRNNGELRPMYNTAKPTLESTINSLLFSYYMKVNTSELSSEEAIQQLKKFKEKLELELITQEEYNKKKAELSKYIK